MDDRVRVRIRVGVRARVRVRDKFTSRSQSMFALRADKDAFELGTQWRCDDCSQYLEIQENAVCRTHC